jgi:hypothetical protein
MILQRIMQVLAKSRHGKDGPTIEDTPFGEAIIRMLDFP